MAQEETSQSGIEPLSPMPARLDLEHPDAQEMRRIESQTRKFVCCFSIINLAVFISVLVAQQVQFKGIWPASNAPGYYAAVWASVWVSTTIVKTLLDMAATHFSLRIVRDPREEGWNVLISILRRLLFLFNFCWFLYGIKPCLVDPIPNATIRNWARGLWYFQLAIMLIPVFFALVIFGLLLFIRHRRPLGQDKMPAATAAALESMTYQQYLGKLTMMPSAVPNDAENLRATLTKAASFLAPIPLGTSDTNDPPKECSVCLRNYSSDETVTLLPCNKFHLFHKACISEWFEKSRQCPLCRADIVELVDKKKEMAADAV
ncbi:MAG: uncharacterized protein KVP18_004864 [Porospora cf. gigantea A]|uniref:uncharacterized protein n=1 Tax=Porospora cf. gigantea A TaxID=2853593 RepID=UPI00355A8B36|nr:MAG: hypothetical protein KVP18_004864 [Porospora cf. gigantea A]